MLVKETVSSEAQVEAKKQLLFYGFWLWNYTTTEYHQEVNYTYTEETYWESLDYALKCDLCPDMNKYCEFCSAHTRERKQHFVKSLFKPWFDDYSLFISDPPEALRYSSSAILQNTYDVLTQKAHKILMDKTFTLRNLPNSIQILNIKKESSYGEGTTLGIKDVVDIRIDLSLPLAASLSGIAKLHKASSDGLLYQSKDCAEDDCLNIDRMRHEVFDYSQLVQHLKSFEGISFRSTNSASRALGFWLWEQVDVLNNFRTVSQAVGFLESGQEFPQDILIGLGYGNSDLTVLTRLKRSTKQCVEQKEVMTMG